MHLEQRFSTFYSIQLSPRSFLATIIHQPIGSFTSVCIIQLNETIDWQISTVIPCCCRSLVNQIPSRRIDRSICYRVREYNIKFFGLCTSRYIVVNCTTYCKLFCYLDTNLLIHPFFLQDLQFMFTTN